MTEWPIDLIPEFLARLRALAEKVTAGPWTPDGDFQDQAVLGPDGVFVADCSIAHRNRPDVVCIANGRWIAAADPPTVLALLDEIERLRARPKAMDGAE